MPKKAQSEERVRFCDNCNAIIGWYATFCDECGLKLGAAPLSGAGAGGVDAGQTPYGDLFRAHLRLLHRYRERAEVLRKRGQRLGKALDREQDRDTKGEEHRLRLIALSERLLEMEDEWREIQHSYNRQSEAIEEDFIAVNEELELDVELPPEMQEALEAEVQGFLSTLEGIQHSLSVNGEELDRALARERSQVLGLPTGGTRPLLVMSGISLLVIGFGAFALWHWRGFSLPDSAFAIAPALLTALLWAVFARSR